jgi:hypothetical protein
MLNLKMDWREVRGGCCEESFYLFLPARFEGLSGRCTKRRWSLVLILVLVFWNRASLRRSMRATDCEPIIAFCRYLYQIQQLIAPLPILHFPQLHNSLLPQLFGAIVLFRQLHVLFVITQLLLQHRKLFLAYLFLGFSTTSLDAPCAAYRLSDGLAGGKGCVYGFAETRFELRRFKHNGCYGFPGVFAEFGEGETSVCNGMDYRWDVCRCVLGGRLGCD